jgi:uncharacterized protein RhaS with RHS repeats
MHYNYFRDYDPATGRYVESDPIGLDGGINTFGYAYASPLRFSDPTGENSYTAGRAAWSVGTSIGGAINSGIAAATGLSLGVIMYNACHSESPEEQKRKNCQALKDSILKTCYGLSPRKRMKCFEAANTSFRQCMGWE